MTDTKNLRLAIMTCVRIYEGIMTSLGTSGRMSEMRAGMMVSAKQSRVIEVRCKNYDS